MKEFPASMDTIEIVRFSHSDGGRRLIENLTLTLAGARTHAIVGPAGAGKSALMRAIAGLAAPDAGYVRVFGTAVTVPTTPELARLLGYVGQGPRLFPHLTAGENVALAGRLDRWSPERVGERRAELGQRLGLPNALWDRPAASLSMAETARAAIVRALLRDPRLVIMDEPFDGLSAEESQALASDVKPLLSGRTAIVALRDASVLEGAEVSLRLSGPREPAR